MKYKLKELVDVQFGLVLNRKEDKSMTSKYKYRVLQSKSIKNNKIDLNNISWFHSIEVIDNDYFTKLNDILFKVTEPFDTVFIKENETGLLVAANFIVLRVSNNIIYPRFLHWYLNRPEIRYKINLLTQGTSIIAIRTSDLLDLLIEVPSLNKQKRIIDFLEIADKELELLSDLLENKKVLYQHIPDEILSK